MTDQGIDKLPYVEKLDKFAQKLPPEFRAELYRHARSFAVVAMADGLFVGAMGSDTKSSREFRHEALVTYLEKQEQQAGRDG